MRNIRKKYIKKFELTEEEKNSCDDYIQNGRKFNLHKKIINKQDNNIMHQAELVKEYIDDKMEFIGRHVELNMIYKLDKIQQIIEDCMQRGQYDTVLRAIAEANKMQGHYSAEKVINLNLDANQHLRELILVSEDLRLEHKKEY
jgi:hypothetical protein